MPGLGPVVVGPGVGGRVGVDGGGLQVGDGVGEVVFSVGGDLVGGGEAQPGVHDHMGFGVQPVADPPQPQGTDILQAGHGTQGGLGPVDQGGVDGALSRR